MKQTSEPMERLRDVIREVRATSEQPNNAPVITTAVMSSFGAELIEDEPLVRLLMYDAVAQQVRTIIKMYRPIEDDETPRQGALWPASMLPMVRQIGRETVFVPSVGEYVNLTPDTDSAIVRESGRYLIAYGEDNTRRGKALIDLADAMDAHKAGE